MKTTILIPLLAGWGLCLAQFSANAQEFKEHISKQFSLEKPAAGSVVAVYNLSGSIKVEGYAGDKVLIEVDKTISADNSQDLETGKKEFKLAFEQKADSIVAYIAEPYDTRPHTWRNYHEDRRINYNYTLEFVIKVPFNVNLCVSTVNDGGIFVKNVYGALKVNNVNGHISIANAKGTTIAHTVNGGVTVTYLAVPSDASSYYTVNGELNITYPAALSANLQFKSMNGEFFTDFPDAVALPAKVVKTQNKRGATTTYKLNKDAEVSIGGGGKLFRFETLNGNIYIKKQS